MNHHEESSSDSELNVNGSEQAQRCCINCRSGVAVVAVITATITFETALHSALVPILPEHLYESSVSGSSSHVNTSQPLGNQRIQKGLPVAISCDGFEKDAFHAKEEVLCQVKQNSIVVFNKTMIWENRTETEYIFDAQKNETFVVDVIGKNRTAHRNESILVQNPYNPCSTDIGFYSIPDSFTVYARNKRLSCIVPENIVPKSKLKELNFTFMKDCQTINDSENYSVESYSEEYIIKINHVSFNKTPGNYTCTIMYKGRHYIFPWMDRFEICVKVKRPPTSTNNPSIETEATVYKVEPGANLTMKCTVPGQHTKDFNMDVLWEKDGKVQNDEDESEEADRKHFTESQIKTERCSPDPNVNVVELQKKAGDTTYAYTLRNVKVEDSGSYNCTLWSQGINAAYSTFTVVVKAPASDSVEGWTIAVIVVAVCSVIVVIAVVLRYKSKREWNFFIKKYFTKRRLVPSSESVAFLVYSEDVFRNNKETNPLQDVIDWMDQTDTPYIIDPNKHCLEMSPEDPGPRSIEEVIKGSETFIIILSMDLLVKNEIEIYTSYMALKNNVSSTHSVIFICTKEMKNFVFKTGERPGTKLGATEKEAAAKTINTFRNFMKRRGNFVISWSPQKRSSFWKDLYVAVPKVKVCAKNMEVTPMFVSEGVV